jgi:hypothetical protein
VRPAIPAVSIAPEIDVDVGADAAGPVGRVNANHWVSLFIELGTVDQPPRPYLRRALESGTARRGL